MEGGRVTRRAAIRPCNAAACAARPPPGWPDGQGQTCRKEAPVLVDVRTGASPYIRVRISESAYPSPPDTGSDAAVSRSSLSRAPGADARPHAPTRIMSDTDSDADCRPHPSLLRPTGARGRAKMNSPGRGPLCWYKRGGPLCWYERFFSRLSLFHALGLDCAIITLHTLMSSGPPTRQTKFKLSLGLMFCN